MPANLRRLSWAVPIKLLHSGSLRPVRREHSGLFSVVLRPLLNQRGPSYYSRWNQLVWGQVCIHIIHDQWCCHSRRRASWRRRSKARVGAGGADSPRGKTSMGANIHWDSTVVHLAIFRYLRLHIKYGLVWVVVLGNPFYNRRILALLRSLRTIIWYGLRFVILKK